MFPTVALLATGEPLLMFTGFLGALIAFITMFGVIAAYLPELYEPRVRCTGAAVGYNLGGVLGGALTPIAATALAEHGGRVPWGVGRGRVSDGDRAAEPGLFRAAARDATGTGGRREPGHGLIASSK